MESTAADFAALLSAMNEAEDNEAKLAACHERAPKKLFSSAQILEVLETTPSVKTKLELVTTLLAPRDGGSAALQAHGRRDHVVAAWRTVPLQAAPRHRWRSRW